MGGLEDRRYSANEHERPRKKVVAALNGERIDVTSCGTVEAMKEAASGHLGLPGDELVLLRGRKLVLEEADLRRDDDTGTTDASPGGEQPQLRVVHRPPPPPGMPLRYACLAAYFLVVVWYTHVDVGPVGLLSTALMVIMFRCTNREMWQAIFPPPPPSGNGTRPTEHLVVVPLYNESEAYLEPMISSLVLARRSWRLTVLFAAEERMSEYWVRKATARLERVGVKVVTVRHPPNIPNEVPGAAANINWALETFCLESPDPARYILTKCDANGVFDEGYLTEIEGYANQFEDDAFFVQSRPCWRYAGKWSRVDAMVHERLKGVPNAGEGGVTHFTFPLAQFIRVGKYSHSNARVLDDSDCYLQQEALGVHYVDSKACVRKWIPTASDLSCRLFEKWIPQAIGTAVVEISFRRSALYTFRLCGSIFFLEILVVCLKSIRHLMT